MNTIWITGARGFIGRHLATYLSGQGLVVFGIGHGAWPENEASKYGVRSWINGEIEGANLHKLAEKSGMPKTIFHLAGGSSVGPSFAYPLEDFNRTVTSTARLLEWVSVNSIQTSVVCVSSAAVYGNLYKIPICEDSRLEPYSPYGFHKLMMETLCQTYGVNFSVPTSIVRLFSVYGVGLEKQLIWDLCVKLSQGNNPMKLHGTGDEIRDWIHVSDAVRLLVHASQYCDNSTPIFNGGTGTGTSVRSIAEMVSSAWGGGIYPKVKFSGESRQGDPRCLLADTSKVVSTGFKTSAPIEKSIEDAVISFKEKAGAL